MDIDFDPLKSSRNREQRGFGFMFAALIFLGRIVETFERPLEGESA